MGQNAFLVKKGIGVTFAMLQCQLSMILSQCLHGVIKPWPDCMAICAWTPIGCTCLTCRTTITIARAPPPAPRNARHVAPAVPRLSQGRTFAATWTARRQRSQRRRQDELANEVRDCGLAHVDCREDLGDTDDDNEDAVCRDVEEGGVATSAL